MVGLVPLGHYQQVDYVYMSLVILVFLKIGCLTLICRSNVACGLVILIF